ncbi:MAG: secondary thiamine-phosphate synthase enzyme YjbQ [Candidatus Micrarchaeota archaeon]
MFTATVKTTRQHQIVDITRIVEEAVEESGTKEGHCLVYLPHATAAIIVGEYEPNLERDYLRFFSEFVPKSDYEHNRIDNNAEAHLKSAFFHSGKVLPVSEGKLVLGTWQSIMLCDFDGPRNRRICVVVK